MRLRLARRIARRYVADAERRCAAARKEALRRELAETVRSVSPFLLSLIELEGLTLDDVAERIVDAPGSPGRTRPSRTGGGLDLHTHGLRHLAASGKRHREPETLHGLGIRQRCGGWVVVRVVAHSLEALTTVGSLTFESRFGELLVRVRGGLPSALAAGAVGRPLDDFVIHPATAGRSWRVEAVETRNADSVLVVITGSLPWRPAPSVVGTDR